MADLSQLPHMLKLLDDESVEIQRQIMDQLEAFGDVLPEALEALPESPDAVVRQRLQQVLARIEGGTPDLNPRQFRPGQLVHHRRYGYRGVIVGFDLSCQADEKWYQHNRTQPERNQPWYHVLVHKTSQVTYAAQSSLEADTVHEPIVHPMIDAFFTSFGPDGYIRNERPWPFA